MTTKMTTKTTTKKLRTSKETLRRLTDELKVVCGGTGDRCPPGDTCFGFKK